MSIVTGFTGVRKAIYMTFFKERNPLLIFLALPVWYGVNVLISGTPPAFGNYGWIAEGLGAIAEIIIVYWIVRGVAALLKGKKVTKDNPTQTRFRWSFIVAFFLAFIVMWNNHLGEIAKENYTSTLRSPIDERIDFCLENNIPPEECITEENLPSLRGHE